MFVGIPTECEDHETLNQPDRAMGNTDQSRLRCDKRAPDNIVDGKWHRLIGNSGTKIPESCVPMRRCGTHAPGWLNGTHPQLQEGQVNRKVCYHWSSRCCNWQNNIKVRSCGDFYVYNLVKPPVCSLRYCGNNNTGRCKTLTYFYFCVFVYLFFLLAPSDISRTTQQHAPPSISRPCIHFCINQSYVSQKETRVFNQVIKDQEIRVKMLLKLGKYINNLIKSLV